MKENSRNNLIDVKGNDLLFIFGLKSSLSYINFFFLSIRRLFNKNLGIILFFMLLSFYYRFDLSSTCSNLLFLIVLSYVGFDESKI